MDTDAAHLENSAISAGGDESLSASFFPESLLSQNPFHLPHWPTVSVDCISAERAV